MTDKNIATKVTELSELERALADLDELELEGEGETANADASADKGEPADKGTSAGKKPTVDKKAAAGNTTPPAEKKKPLPQKTETAKKVATATGSKAKTDDKTKLVVSDSASAAIDELDDLLADVENEAAVIDAVNKADDLDALTDVENEALVEAAKAESYRDADIAAAAEEAGKAPVAETEPVIETKSDAAEPTAETETARPKARAHGAAKPSEALLARLGGVDAVESTLILTPEDAKLDADHLKETIATRMSEIDKAPKKVGEKLVNAYSHLNGGATLSVYTQYALEILLEKGTMTSDELFNRYRERPYSVGTSRSQSGQLMQVLPLMGIAQRNGKQLTLIEDSVLAAAFAEKLGIEMKAA